MQLSVSTTNHIYGITLILIIFENLTINFWREPQQLLINIQGQTVPTTTKKPTPQY